MSSQQRRALRIGEGREEQGGERQATQLSRGSGGRAIQISRKRQRRISSCTSPRPTFLARHSNFNWYEADVWTEVAKFLDGSDLVRLGLVNRWFSRLIDEDGIWKHACLRELHVPPPRRVSFPWRHLYASAFDGSHSYSFRQQEKHIDRMRIGAFFFDSPLALLTENLALPKKLPRPADDPAKTIQTTGTCLLTNARTGIWIADLQLVRCPVCNMNTCEGTMQVLDARHMELFLEEGFKNGRWEYEDIGSSRIERPSTTATGAIFDVKYLRDPCTAGVLDGKAWIGQKDDWQPKARLSLHAVAVNTNLQPNEGLQVRFQAMRSTGVDETLMTVKASEGLTALTRTLNSGKQDDFQSPHKKKT